MSPDLIACLRRVCSAWEAGEGRTVDAIKDAIKALAAHDLAESQRAASVPSPHKTTMYFDGSAVEMFGVNVNEVVDRASANAVAEVCAALAIVCWLQDLARWQAPPVDHAGKTLGQVAFEATNKCPLEWDDLPSDHHDLCEHFVGAAIDEHMRRLALKVRALLERHGLVGK